MKRSLLVVLLALVACEGYQLQPEVGYSTGEQGGLGISRWGSGGDVFDNLDHDLWSVWFALTLVPPTRFHPEHVAYLKSLALFWANRPSAAPRQEPLHEEKPPTSRKTRAPAREQRVREKIPVQGGKPRKGETGYEGLAETAGGYGWKTWLGGSLFVLCLAVLAFVWRRKVVAKRNSKPC